MYTSSKPDHTQVHILPCTCTGVCEGRKLAVDRMRKDSYCWIGTPKGQKFCNQLYTNKATPPQPCVWDAESRACLRNAKRTCLTCPKCSTITDRRNKDGIDMAGESSCCAPGGAWNGKCSDEGDLEYTWAQGIKACKCECSICLC